MTSVPPSDNSTGNTAKRDRQSSALFVIVAVALLCVSAIQVAWLAWKHDPRVHVPARVAFFLAFVLLPAAAAGGP